MAQYRIPHPWNPRFALPANVMAEPPGRHTITTAQRARKSFDMPGYVPKAWRGGFDIPKYIKQENIGRGAASAMQRTRKTFDAMIPDALGDIEAPMPYRLSQEVYALDGVSDVIGSASDPFQQYGDRVGEFLMGTIDQVPPEWREPALKAVLKELDPGLPDIVASRTKQYMKSLGLDAKSAMQYAIASSVSEGFSKEVVNAGRTGKMPPAKSIMGLGMYEGALEDAYAGLAISLDGYEAMGYCGYSCMKRKAKAATQKAYDLARAPDRAVVKGAQWTGSKIASGAKTAYSWGKTAVKKVWSLNCKVMKSKLSDVAAGAVATYYGVPPQVGVAGHQAVTGAVCGKDGKPLTEEEMAELTEPGGLLNSGKTPWLLYGGIGAVGLVAVLMLTKK